MPAKLVLPSHDVCNTHTQAQFFQASSSHLILTGVYFAGDLSKASRAHAFRCVFAIIASVPYYSYCYD
jgi:hypothetical protein